MQTWQTLVGAGPTETILNFTCSVAPCSTAGAGVGIVIASATASPPSQLGGGLGGLQHLTVYGPAVPANQDYPTQPIGVLVGGDPSNIINSSAWFGDNVRLEDVVILGWVSGVQFGNHAYLDKFQNVRWNTNIYNLFAPASLVDSGQSIVVSTCQFVNGVPGTTGILDYNGMEWMIDNSTFDGILGPSIVVAGGNPLGNHLNISHSHFEAVSNTLPSSGFITNVWAGYSGTPTISIQDTTFLVDTTGSSAPAMINTSARVSQLNIVGGWVDSAQDISTS